MNPACPSHRLNSAKEADEKSRGRSQGASGKPSGPPISALSLPKPLADRGGSLSCKEWVPSDVWNKLGEYVENTAELKSLRESCASGFNSVAVAQAPKISDAMKRFTGLELIVPRALLDKAVMMYPVIPHGRGVNVFVDESANPGRGIELVWLEGGLTTQMKIPLGIPTHPLSVAKSVSNVRFAPSGNHLAMLVTVKGSCSLLDELSRFRCSRIPEGSVFKPQGDCIIQVVDLTRNSDGRPRGLRIYTFGHTFVPEYGFDLGWRAERANIAPELVFAGMLHTSQGTAIFAGRWRSFRESETEISASSGIMSSTSHVFEHDRSKAVLERKATHVTSRVELSDDGLSVFYDTMSKCGVMKLDPDFSARVRKISMFDAEYRPSALPLRGSSFPKISRMSPDGSLVCTLVNVHSDRATGGQRNVINMLRVPSGDPVFCVALNVGRSSPYGSDRKFDKHADLAYSVMGFSKDSSLFWVRYCKLTTQKCWVDNGSLPAIFDSRSGRKIRDFGRVGLPYHSLQMAPDALTVFGARLEPGAYAMDAIDVVSGKVVKTVRFPGATPMTVPFLGW